MNGPARGPVVPTTDNCLRAVAILLLAIIALSAVIVVLP